MFIFQIIVRRAPRLGRGHKFSRTFPPGRGRFAASRVTRRVFSRNFSGAAAVRHGDDYDLALQFAAEQAKHDFAAAAAALGDAEARLKEMKRNGVTLSREELVRCSRDEFTKLLKDFGVCTEAEVDKCVDAADTNGDGVLDLREFDVFVTDLRRSIHGRGEDPMDPATGCPHAL